MGVAELLRALVDIFGQFSVERKSLNFKKAQVDVNADMYGSIAKTLGSGKRDSMIALLDRMSNSADLETLLMTGLENDMKEMISQLSRYNPELTTLDLCIDGIPPFAKMVQQRERRFAAAAEYDAETRMLDAIIEQVKKPQDRGEDGKIIKSSVVATNALQNLRGDYEQLSDDERTAIDTLRGFVSYKQPGQTAVPKQTVLERLHALRDTLRFQASPNLTPGTNFMVRIDKMIRTMIERDRSTWNIPNIMYSSFHVPGEGEHKIFDILREESGIEQQDPLLLRSPDADVILLALLSGRRNMYIQKNDGYTVLDVDKLRAALQLRVQSREMLEDDFVFALSALGNDFMPPLVEMFDYKAFMSTFLDYLKMSPLFLAGSSSVYWTNYFDMLQTLRPREALELRLKEKPFDFGNQYIEGDFDYDTFRTAWYWRFLGVQPDEAAKKESMLALLKLTETELIERIARQAVTRYLNTAYFVYSYYKNGRTAVSSTWAYAEYYPPLLEDLIQLGREITATSALSEWKNRGENQLYQSSLYQLAMVLPKSNDYLLPTKMQKLSKTDELGYLYPEKYWRSQDYRLRSFQEVSLLPVPDAKQLMQYLDTTIVPQLPKAVVAQHVAGVAQFVSTAKRRKVEKQPAGAPKSRFGRSIQQERGRGNSARGKRGRGRGNR